MSRSRLLGSALGLALLACAPVPDLEAVVRREKATDATVILKGGIHYLRRIMGLERDTAVVSHTVSLSPREASVELELADGTTRTVALRGGEILVDGSPMGRYRSGGALDRAWRRLLTEGSASDTRALLAAARSFRVPGLAADDATAVRHLVAAFRNLTAAPVREPGGIAAAAELAAAAATQGLAAQISDSITRALTMADVATLDSLERALQGIPDIGTDVAVSVRRSPLRVGHVTVRAGETVRGNLVVFRGDVDVYGTVTGNVVALMGDVISHDGGLIEGSAVAVGGRVVEAGGSVRGDIKTLSGLDEHAAKLDRQVARRSAFDGLFHDVGTVVAFFFALYMVGFGAVFFGRRYVEVVADTTTHSFGRSFVVGMLGQLLLLPALAMMIVGLVLTIVGILVLPFAILAFVLGAALAVLGGYLAVAHAVGETVTRRRMANGAFVRSPNSYGYIFTGLLGLLGLWAAAALFGWLGPVVLLFKVAAVLVTWVAATTGFGAVLLSRAGMRETFAGRYSGEVTDEYLWATPPATPTAARMGRQP